MERQQAGATGYRLEDISTDWAIVRDPARFVLRYAPAIRRYLGVLIANPHDAEEVAQDFFLRVTRHGFARTRQAGGRFRDYLKAALRHAALNHLRAGRRPRPVGLDALRAEVPDKAQVAADRAWDAGWRRCLLDRAFRAVEEHQGHSAGNLFHTVLSLLADNPLDDTTTLAARTSALVGRPVRAEAFRKQVSRARSMLAGLLAKEVARTLDDPTPEQVQEELMELALWEYVRDFLPAPAADPPHPSRHSPPRTPPRGR